MNWKLQGETPVVKTADYYFCLEEYRRDKDQMVFVHLEVYNWTPRVFKELLSRWKLFRKHVTCPLYAVPGPDASEKWEAFVSLLGFKFLTNVVCENGAERPLFLNIKENKKNERKVHTDDRSEPIADAERVLPGKPVGSAAAVSADGVQ